MPREIVTTQGGDGQQKGGKLGKPSDVSVGSNPLGSQQALLGPSW